MSVVKNLKPFSSNLWKCCESHNKSRCESNFSSKVYTPFFLPLPHLFARFITVNCSMQCEKKFEQCLFSLITSAWILCLIPQTKRVPPPCKVAKSIIAEPSQTWYLIEASNWIPRNRNMDIPRSTGRSSRARQASDNKPQRVAILKNLYCHLKPGTDDFTRQLVYFEQK